MRLTEKFQQLWRPIRYGLKVLYRAFVDPDPPVPPQPTKLKVFAAGLPRSGTTSLTAALTTLGYHPCHFSTCGPELVSILEDHYAPPYADNHTSNLDIIQFQETLGYDVQGLDGFGWKLWREAVSMPDVKIILTQHPRGGEGWAESFTSSITPGMQAVSRPPFTFMNVFVQQAKLNDEILSYLASLATECKDCPNSPYHPLFSYPGSDLAAAYEKHKQSVVAGVPPRRLLIFNPTHGFGPLCEFLELENSLCLGEYPRVNDRFNIHLLTKLATLLNWAWLGLLLVSVVVLGLFISRLCKTIGLRVKKKVE